MKILVLILSLLLGQCLASPAFGQQDLGDIIETLDANKQNAQTEHRAEQSTVPGATHTSGAHTSSATHTISGELGLLPHLSVTSGQSSAKGTSTQTLSVPVSVFTNPTTHSIIGTVPPLPSYPPRPTSAFQTATASGPTQSSTTTASASSSKPFSGVSKQWKIVGVAVIAFTSVAAILLLVVFFDQWTGFIKDLLWKRNEKDGDEELVPDWEKANWDVRLGPDKHRYPSFATLPSDALDQGLGFAPAQNTTYAKGPLERSTSNRAPAGLFREDTIDFPPSFNPYSYHAPTSNAIANQYTSPLPVPPATARRTSYLQSHRTQDANSNPPKSPGMGSIYGGLAV